MDYFNSEIKKKKNTIAKNEIKQSNSNYIVEDNQDTMSYCRPFGESNQKVIFPSPEKVLYALGKI